MEARILDVLCTPVAGGGRRGRRRPAPAASLSEAAANLGSLCEGLRPAFLWDFPGLHITDSERALAMSKLARSESLDVAVLVLDGDHFLVRRDLLRDSCRRRFPGIVALVDLSREQPSLVPKDRACELLADFAGILLEKTQSPDQELLELSREEAGGLNLTCLAGILLGYPVVYWYGEETGASSSLEHTELVVTSVACRKGAESGSARLFQFSYPRSLHVELSPEVQSWACGLMSSHPNVDIKSEIVVANSLAL